MDGIALFLYQSVLGALMGWILLECRVAWRAVVASVKTFLTSYDCVEARHDCKMVLETTMCCRDQVSIKLLVDEGPSHHRQLPGAEVIHLHDSVPSSSGLSWPVLSKSVRS
ncbi:uncharacterized protein LOC143021733 [Oratosquilla oratoria]|uniref:uncharacterized protein LOC143021733 n=1 Tax=Oratosquilla oratoria TaxID=337810 RepID=UPI003F7579FE